MTLRSATSSLLRRLLSDERGNVFTILAFALPVLIGCAGLAVDTIQWVYAKRNLQASADSAAIAGVLGLVQGSDMDEAVDRNLASRAGLDPARSVSAERSPEGYGEDPFAVRVRISTPVRLTFSSLFLRTRPSISVEATATIVESGDFCTFALGGDDETGVRIEPGSDLEMECGIASNSSSAKAIEADGSASVSAVKVTAFGGIGLDGMGSAKLRPYGVRQKDPLEGTEPPLVPNTGCPNVTVNADAAQSNGGPITLEPGCFGNLVLNGPVTLGDGEFILNRGNLIVGPTAEVSCKACTIFLTSDQAAENPTSIGKVQIDGHAKVKLAAPTEGPNAGILIYQDRHAAGDHDGIENVIGGNSFSQLKGLVYLPAETLRVDGRWTPDVQCARFVGKRLILQGRLMIAKDCDSNGVIKLRLTDVKLVA